MALDLQKLFKKKPGGTVVGNLIRVVANKASNGVFGTGANRIQATPENIAAWENENKKDFTADTTASKIAASIGSNLTETPQGQALVKEGVQGEAQGFFKKYALAIGGGVLALVAIIVFMFKGGDKRGSRR